MLDGSADSFLRPFTRIAQLFPADAVVSDEGDGYDGSEEGGDGDYERHRGWPEEVEE